MKIKFLYRKNLKMSPNKLGAQTAHVAANLCMMSSQIEEGYAFPETVIHIVLGVSDKKFEEKLQELIDTDDQSWYVTTDVGFTEVPAGTQTCLGYLDEK